jgi:hypothetical protein
VEARVELLPVASGGLHSPMPTGARSLMLVFPSLEYPGEEVKIGAVIRDPAKSFMRSEAALASGGVAGVVTVGGGNVRVAVQAQQADGQAAQ